MKALSLFAAAAIGLSVPVRAQLYVEAHGTYLLPIGGLSYSSYDNTEVTVSRVNLGRGAGGGLTIGAALGHVLSAEVRGTYVPVAKQELTSHSANLFSDYSNTQTYSGSYMRLDAALRATGGEGKLRGYAAVGPSFSLAPKAMAQNNTETIFTTGSELRQVFISKKELSGGIGWGGFGAIGLTYAAGHTVGFFAEVQATAQTWAPTKDKGESTGTTYFTDGTSAVESNSYDVELKETYNPDNEHETGRMDVPTSTWGFRAGIRFLFAGPREEAPRPDPAGT